ncbi:hypothetical protein [Parablautia intestinalis]|nr:hypothetical protein [Parablautia intestinalis]
MTTVVPIYEHYSEEAYRDWLENKKHHKLFQFFCHKGKDILSK